MGNKPNNKIFPTSVNMRDERVETGVRPPQLTFACTGVDAGALTMFF